MTDKTNSHDGLHPKVTELTRGDNFAALTTIMPDGHPQTQVMWVDTEGDHLLINTEVHRQKFRNVERDPNTTCQRYCPTGRRSGSKSPTAADRG